jgi:hypothetical protein
MIQRMIVKPKNTVPNVLISSSLKDQLSDEITNEAFDQSNVYNNSITVVLNLSFGSTPNVMVGMLRSVLFDFEPEIDVRMQAADAFGIVSANNVSVLGIEIHRGENVVTLGQGPFVIKCARIDEISIADGLCTLSLGLKRHPR